MAKVKGSSGNEKLNGKDGNDTIHGRSGNDKLDGKGGNDKLFGDKGDDKIKGNDGNDEVYGGKGIDKLKGGDGADSFIFEALNTSKAGDGKRDLIGDFSQADGDKIDLSNIDADLNLGGDDPFTLIGTDGLDSAGGFGKVRYEFVGDTTLIQVDLQGDGDFEPDLEILLKGNITLTEGDFVL